MSTPHRSPDVRRALPSALLAVVSLVALYLRWKSGDRSWLWYDEYYSAVFATTSHADAAREAIDKIDFHPPLYYLQLRWWAVISPSEGWLLGNSLAWSAISLAGAFFAGRKLSGFAGGLCSVALLALLPLAVRQAGELRMYAMLIGLCPWALWAALCQLESANSWKWSLATVALGSAIVWSHGAGILWLGVWGLLAVGHIAIDRTLRRGLRSAVASLGATAVLSVLPLQRALERRPGHLQDSEATAWGKLVAELVPGSGDGALLVTGAVLTLAALLLGSERKRFSPIAILLATIVGFSCSFWMLGTKLPVVHIRSVTFMGPVVCVAIGGAIGASLYSNRQALRWLGVGILASVVWLSGAATLQQLEQIDRSSEHHRLARSLSKVLHADEPVWAPRVGTAYALCWELVPNRTTIHPTASLTCKATSGNPIYAGSMRPAALRAPYRLILRKGERTPRLRGGESASKPKKVGGHRMMRVMPR